MAANINKVFLVGRTGKDPDTRQVGQGGARLATIRLATSTGGYKRRDGTEVPEKTQWHNVQCWDRLADIVSAYVKKGDRLTVVGRIEYGEYKGQDGSTRYVTNIVAEDLVLDPRPHFDEDQAGGGQAKRQPDPWGNNDDIPF